MCNLWQCTINDTFIYYIMYYSIMEDLDSIMELKECSKCHKLFELKDLYKVERFSFPFSRNKSYLLICKKCAGK